MDSYQPVMPGSKRFKKMVVRTVLFVLGRAMQSASKYDVEIKRELAVLPDNLRIQMQILPSGPCMTVVTQNGKLKYLGQKPMEADMIVIYKNLESAFMLFTAQKGIAKSYAEHRLSLRGDLSYAMVFTRCIIIIQGYLFPKIINNRIMKRVPAMSLKKHFIRLWLYSFGISTGL
ncbi:hypothetical protein KJ966_03300 [bacterium]|nr:hypothetical protein [bacterium]